MPEGEGSEAYINMNNVMRQMGCDAQAHKLTWLRVGRSFEQDNQSGISFEEPVPIDCR